MLPVSRSMDLWKIICIFSLGLTDKLLFPPLAPNIFFCFKNHQKAVFFFFFLFLLFSRPSSALQWHYEEGNFFSEYDQSYWSLYLGCYLEAYTSICSRTCSLVTFSDHFIFSSARHFQVLQISEVKYSEDIIQPCICLILPFHMMKSVSIFCRSISWLKFCEIFL